MNINYSNLRSDVLFSHWLCLIQTNVVYTIIIIIMFTVDQWL